MKIFTILFASFVFFSCNESTKQPEQEMKPTTKQFPNPDFSINEANKLITLPLNCVSTQYPNKPGLTLDSEEDLQTPKTLHPVFYGCYDWHSAVHGYWSMVTLLRQFPELDRAEEVRTLLKKRITPENIALETAYFKAESNKSFERTYGWAWLLKLAEELHRWDDPLAKELQKNLQPLTQIICTRYKEFLPKLLYPIRVGEHTNTAFGLSFALDYAVTVGDRELEELILLRAKHFYQNDQNCPINWEPGGYDFFSPCFEEIGLMQRVLPKKEFLAWVNDFMPQLANTAYHLEPGKVSDRKDGKLVHLDGLNFSRAWHLYALAKQYPEKYAHLKNLANEHMAYSYPNLIGDAYEGGHWLGSFAIYALNNL